MRRRAKEKKGFYSSCELPEQIEHRPQKNRNRLYRFRSDVFRWRGVKQESYKTYGVDWQGIVRQNIIGMHGETTKFHFRYFEINPGGNSSFEVHRHEHVVVCVRGRGKVKLNKRTVELQYLDVLYIAPETPHQLFNPYDEPFGFFCIVNARRDRPRPVKG